MIPTATTLPPLTRWIDQPPLWTDCPAVMRKLFKDRAREQINKQTKKLSNGWLFRLLLYASLHSLANAPLCFSPDKSEMKKTSKQKTPQQLLESPVFGISVFVHAHYSKGDRYLLLKLSFQVWVCVPQQAQTYHMIVCTSRNWNAPRVGYIGAGGVCSRHKHTQTQT